MATVPSAVTKLGNYLLLLHQQRATGELVITHSRQASLQWRIYFYLGRLVYATGGTHPVRRWYRSFKYHCPEQFSVDWLIRAQSEAELWEIDLLNQSLRQGDIDAKQYKTVLQAMIQEVFFTVLGQKCFTTQWHPGKQIPQQVVFLSVSQLLYDTQQLRQQWQDSGLGFLQELMSQFSPDLAPVLRHRSQVPEASSTSKSMMHLMKGQLTFWDLALELKRSLPEVLRALSPLIRQGVVELREIADLPSPCPPPTMSSAEPVSIKALIACIDNDSAIIEAIAQTLKPHSYEVLSISRPLDLILFDPIMPGTNGYELCTLLRKSPAFQNTPIIILTHQDGMIDRVRARLAGASEFLSKPLDPAQVVQVVQKHLRVVAEMKAAVHANWIVA
jgi:two-component system, chemotaxis family, response regulator PixG